MPKSELAVKKAVGKTKKAWGQDIPELKFPYSWNVFKSYEQLVEHGEVPTNTQILKFKNATEKNNARQKAMEEAWKEAGYVKPTNETDLQFRLQSFYDLMILSGKSHQEARSLASNIVGVKWLDEMTEEEKAAYKASLKAAATSEEDEDEDEAENGAA